MLTKVEVRPQQGNLLTLLLQNPDNGLIVRSIDGLGPVKAELVSSSYAGQDGSQPMSARRGERDVRITLGVDPGYGISTVEELRRALYAYVMPKSWVNLKFFYGSIEAEIDGQVESVDPVYFTDDPEVVISIRCFNPDFENREILGANGLSAQYEGGIVIPYEGSIETGFLFQLQIDRPIVSFTMFRQNGDVLDGMDFAISLEAGDILTVSTVAGKKSVVLMNDTHESSVLYGLSPYSPWLTLLPGNNVITLRSEVVGVPWAMQWTTKYGGL